MALWAAWRSVKGRQNMVAPKLGLNAYEIKSEVLKIAAIVQG